MGRSLARTLALCEKHRVSKFVETDDELTLEFFAPVGTPACLVDALGQKSAPLAGNPARAPEVEEAVAALDRAYLLDDEATDEPARDTAAIIAEIDAAAKAGE